MAIEGIFLGVVVGIPSAFVFLLLVRRVINLRRGPGVDNDTQWLITQFLALPTFVLGGPWFATDLVEFFDWSELKFSYTATVGSILGVIGFAFLIIFAIQTGSDMLREEGANA